MNHLVEVVANLSLHCKDSWKNFVIDKYLEGDILRLCKYLLSIDFSILKIIDVVF